MSTLSKYLILLAFSILTPVAHADHLTEGLLPRLGNYRGYIVMEGAGLKIPVSMDTVRACEGTKRPLIVSLRLMFGGFRSHEYITQNYRFSDYDWEDPAITLDINDGMNGPDISLLDGMFSADGMNLEGKIQTAKGGNITGKIHLVYMTESAAANESALAKIFSDVPIIPSLTGEYSGECDFEPTVLQLESVKTNAGEFDSGSPFEGYTVYGRWGKLNRSSFLSTRVKYMLETSFDDTQFNFYEPSIFIPTLGRTCKITADGIECPTPEGYGTCILRKDQQSVLLDALTEAPAELPSAAASEIQSIAKTRDIALAWPPKDKDLTGTYSGYIYLSQRNAFERLTLDFNLAGDPDPSSKVTTRPLLSMISKIFIGNEIDSGQFLYYKFQQLTVPHEKPEVLTFLGKDDAMIQITQWNKNFIAGTWYSRAFGNVGHFKLALHKPGTKETSILPSDGLGFAPSLQGDYGEPGGTVGNNNHLFLQVIPVQTKSFSRVYPFRFRGQHLTTKTFKSQTVRNSDMIVGGNFDPFMGVLSLRLANNSHVVAKITNIKGKEPGLYVYFSGTSTYRDAIIPQYPVFLKKMSNRAMP